MTSLAMLQGIDTWRLRVFSNVQMQRLLKFWSASSDQNIRDHHLRRWSIYFGLLKFADCSIFDKPVHHCRTSPHLCREFGKGIKTTKSPVTLGHSGFKGSHFPWEVGPVCNKRIIRALCPYLDFWRESFRARKKRLATRARRLTK